MMKINIGIVGLGFGKEFIPIYQRHPDCEDVYICARTEQTLKETAKQFGIPASNCYTDYNEMLRNDAIDAIHINTPIPIHAEQSIAGLEAGKHVACTVPAAINLNDLKKIVYLQKSTGKNYMMMETTVYTREFLYVKSLMDQGEFGSLSFVSGTHYQNMEGWPGYWFGFPPMYYATHAVAPLFAITNSRPTYVHCMGSGLVSNELRKPYGNPYRFESALFALDKEGMSAQANRFLFETQRQYTESFNIYGEKLSFEWQQSENELPILFRGESAQRILDIPDRSDLLPPEIAAFTKSGVYGDDNEHLSFIQGAGHGGSHPHMCHEFIRSIVETRLPSIDAVTAAYWTAAGICAHESALQNGKEVLIPRFEKI